MNVKHIVHFFKHHMLVLGIIILLIVGLSGFKNHFFCVYNNMLWNFVLKKDIPPNVLYDCRVVFGRTAILLKGKGLMSLTFCKRFVGVSQFVLIDTNVSDISDICNNQLISLKLVNSPVKSLTALSNCSNLHYLDLQNTDVTDLSPLKGMHLKTLTLVNMNITNIDVLSSTPLTELFVCGCPIKNIETIKACSNLVHIQLENIPITNIDPLGDLKKLGNVTIINCPINSIKCLKRNDYVQIVLEKTNILEVKKEIERLTINGKGPVP